MTSTLGNRWSDYKRCHSKRSIDTTGIMNVDLSGYQPAGNYLTSVPIGGSSIGGVKNGGNVTINADGTMDAKGSGGVTRNLIESWIDLSKALAIRGTIGGFSANTISNKFITCNFAVYDDSTIISTGYIWDVSGILGYILNLDNGGIMTYMTSENTLDTEVLSSAMDFRGCYI